MLPLLLSSDVVVITLDRASLRDKWELKPFYAECNAKLREIVNVLKPDEIKNQGDGDREHGDDREEKKWLV